MYMTYLRVIPAIILPLSHRWSVKPWLSFDTLGKMFCCVLNVGISLGFRILIIIECREGKKNVEKTSVIHGISHNVVKTYCLYNISHIAGSP